jgi:hypothetical protein
MVDKASQRQNLATEQRQEDHFGRSLALSIRRTQLSTTHRTHKNKIDVSPKVQILNEKKRTLN